MKKNPSYKNSLSWNQCTYLRSNIPNRYMYDSVVHVFDLETLTDSKGVLNVVSIGWTDSKVLKERKRSTESLYFHSMKRDRTIYPLVEELKNDLDADYNVYTLCTPLTLKGPMCGVYLLQQWLYRYILIKDNNNKIYMAHNGGRFDNIFILKALVGIIKNPEQNIKVLQVNNSIVKITVRISKNAKVIFQDSYPILGRQSLKKTGLALNKKYFKKDVDICDMNKNNYFSAYFREYLIYDVLTLKESLEVYQKNIFAKFGVNPLACVSISELSMLIYRKCFYSSKNRVGNAQNLKYSKWLRSSYKGGRVECYVPKAENVYSYDINSCYPYVMKSFDLPVGIPKVYKGCIDDLFGFAEVEVKVPKSLNIPFLTIKSDDSTMSTYAPTGTVKGVFFSEELKHAIKLGCKIVKIHKAVSYDRARPFDKFIDVFWNIKAASDKGSVEYYIAKLFMNSLSGKFGQRHQYEEIKIYSQEEKIPKDRECLIQKLTTGHFWVKEKYGVEDIGDITFCDKRTDSIKMFNTHRAIIKQVGSVAIISAITAYARVHLDKYVRIIEANKGKVLYCDTDSIISDVKLPKEYLGEGLGYMKETHANEGLIDQYLSLGKKVKSIKVGSVYECTFRGFNQIKSSKTPKEIHEEMLKIVNDIELDKQDPLLRLEYEGLGIDWLDLGVKQEKKVGVVKEIVKTRIPVLKQIGDKFVWNNTKPLHMVLNQPPTNDLIINEKRSEYYQRNIHPIQYENRLTMEFKDIEKSNIPRRGLVNIFINNNQYYQIHHGEINSTDLIKYIEKFFNTPMSELLKDKIRLLNNKEEYMEMTESQTLVYIMWLENKIDSIKLLIKY